MRRSYVTAALSAAALVLVAGCSDDESAEEPTQEEQTTDSGTDEATDPVEEETTEDTGGDTDAAACLIGTWNADPADFQEAFEQGLGGAEVGEVDFNLQYIFEEGGDGRVEANVAMVQTQEAQGTEVEVHVEVIAQGLVDYEVDGNSLEILSVEDGDSEITTTVYQDGDVVDGPTTEATEIPGLATLPTGSSAYECGGDELVLDADTAGAITLARD